uniref:Uncharacterized protein n=1 Tax=Clastoptera arizonana TaxID=38151 RepID=A0A1B6C8T6_9HEMI
MKKPLFEYPNHIIPRKLTIPVFTQPTEKIDPSKGDIPLVLDSPSVLVVKIQVAVTEQSCRLSVRGDIDVQVVVSVVTGRQTVGTLEGALYLIGVETSCYLGGRSEEPYCNSMVGQAFEF